MGIEPRSPGTFHFGIAERVPIASRSGASSWGGDAAHQMPPMGAFGANTGVHDAANLGWKLAMVLRGEAGAALLEGAA